MEKALHCSWISRVTVQMEGVTSSSKGGVLLLLLIIALQGGKEAGRPLCGTYMLEICGAENQDKRGVEILGSKQIKDCLGDSHGSLFTSCQGQYCCTVPVLSNILSVLVVGCLGRTVQIKLHTPSALEALCAEAMNTDLYFTLVYHRNFSSPCSNSFCLSISEQPFGATGKQTHHRNKAGSRKLHRSEEARQSFLTATMLHRFRQNLLFPPFTWAAAALSAAAGAAAVLLPALHPGLAGSKLSRLHIAKEEERWSRGFFFYWFWKPRVAICDDFGVFCGRAEGGESKGVNLG
ncbi:uncharacterized protein LOC134420058 isoform X1 [Melospiza melodia melodia]|uniref:uncharacterized protein LOC134420058 isoform X1 n=1 Tax=Melospiza melodia melodia TaxID=1914991 RepID=UPI002FD2FC22